jgi:hypothetical protein
MTAKDTAEELVHRYRVLLMDDGEDYGEEILVSMLSKQCALIAVDEILNSRPLKPNDADWDDCGATHKYWYDAQKEEALKFWQEVRKEILSL